MLVHRCTEEYIVVGLRDAKHVIQSDFIHFNPVLYSLSLMQDYLKSCQEQIEQLLVNSLKESQDPQKQEGGATSKTPDSQNLSCTPTDVRDVNL